MSVKLTLEDLEARIDDLREDLRSDCDDLEGRIEDLEYERKQQASGDDDDTLQEILDRLRYLEMRLDRLDRRAS